MARGAVGSVSAAAIFVVAGTAESRTTESTGSGSDRRTFESATALVTDDCTGDATESGSADGATFRIGTCGA